MSFHSEQTAIHRIHFVEYADAAARLAATGFTSVDIGKVSRQLDNNTFYILTTIAPTWVEITIAAGNVLTVDNLVAGQLLIGDGGFDILTEPELLWSGTGLGIGITPVGRLHVFEDTAFGGPSGGVTIEQAGAGDAMLHFLRTGGTPWITGIDGDQGDAYKVQPNSTFNSVLGMTILTDGNVGFGILPDMSKLHLLGSIGDILPFIRYSQTGAFGVTISDFFGSNDPEGVTPALAPGDSYRRSSGVDSGIFIFKGAAPGTTGWEEVLTGTGGSGVTTSDVLTGNRLLTGNGGVDVVVEPTMSFSGGFFLIDDDVAASVAMSLANKDTQVIFSVNDVVFLQQYIKQTGVAIMDFFAQPLDGTSVADYRFGRESTSTGNNRILLFEPNGTLVQTRLSSSGDASFINAQGGFLGIGFTTPVSPLHVYQDNNNQLANAGITVEQDGTGDAVTQFLISGIQRWVLGIDNSDADKFKINNSLGLDASAPFTITVPGLIGIGDTNPDTKLDIDGNGDDALRLRSGNASGNALNQVKMSLDSGLLFTHAIKTRHHATNQFDNFIDFYLWDADEDASGDVGTLPVFHIRGDGRIGVNVSSPSAIVDIDSSFGDTTPIIAMKSGSSVGAARFFAGNRIPDGLVNGASPDLYFHDSDETSGVFENRGVGTNNNWLKHDVSPSEVIEITNSAEFDALASGGIVTISSATTLVVKAPITTANRIVVSGPGTLLHITANNNATSSITYTGTATFFTSAGGALQIRALMQVISTSTGTLLDIDGGPGINFAEASIIGWDDLGTIANTGFLTSQSRYLNIGVGLTLTNTFFVNASVILLIGAPFNGPFFTINLNNPASALSFVDVQGIALGAAGSLFDLDTRVNNNASIKINQCSARNGNLFKPSVLTDATINSVADGSPATGTITAMADNGSGGTTISSTTTYFEDEEVTISGTTSYNGEFQIFNVVAGVSFDTITAFVANDATGSVDSTRLTLSLATGHGISIGDSIKVIDTNFYNGFETTLNVVSDDITVNGVFISTNIGSIERELSLDQSDPRVSAMDNNGFVDSHAIACGHINNNNDATTIAVSNTFNDMVFGTVGDALIASTTMERWKLVDEVKGIFEYIGQEPFDGTVGFDFTLVSAGGAEDFRFKWQCDAGAGFVDLPDNVEGVVNVGTSFRSLTKTFPLVAVKTNRIKPVATRNSGTSTVTAAYVSIYVSE